MAEQSHFSKILKASTEIDSGSQRLYDQAYEPKFPDGFSLPNKKKLPLYIKVIGRGHQAILEIGCGPGDLTSQ